MFNLSKVDKIYLYPGATDFRKDINGLSILVGNNLKTNCIYVFCNSKLKDIKILFVEANAISIFHKRLLKNKFSYPRSGEQTLATLEQIKSILNNPDFVNSIERKKCDRIDVF